MFVVFSPQDRPLSLTDSQYTQSLRQTDPPKQYTGRWLNPISHNLPNRNSFHHYFSRSFFQQVLQADSRSFKSCDNGTLIEFQQNL